MANDFSAYIPQMWANESLLILQDNIVAANLVYRDFEPEVADFGDTVNTRSRGTFASKRKVATDNVTDQDATATNVAVKLDQLVHISFLVHDADQSKAFKDLVTEYLTPASIAMAKFLDQLVLGQYPQFLGTCVPGVGTGSSSNIKDRVLDARNKMNINKVPEGGRNLIWTPDSETMALKVDAFTQAQILEDGGLAMREAALGRKFGFQNYMSQLASSHLSTSIDAVTGAVNNGSGYVKGTTSIAVDGFTAAIGNNSFVSIAGDVQRVVSTTGGTAPSAMVITPGLRADVVNDAVITLVDPGAVNLVAGYAQYYSKEILIDGVTNFPVVGQMVSFGTTSTNPIYTIIQADSSAGTILLDRPLEAALTNDTVANFGPPGNYNLAFHRDAMALVVRPLRMIPSDMGCRSAVVNGPSASMRVTMAYDSQKQAIRVTMDMLCGIKVLNASLGCVLCA